MLSDLLNRRYSSSYRSQGIGNGQWAMGNGSTYPIVLITEPFFRLLFLVIN
jgi:hypothetical protein